MTVEITSKLPDVGTTIFTVMSALAAEHDAINLSQGFPDFEPPEGLRERVGYHLANGHNQYPPMHGIAPLREAIARDIERRYGVRADAQDEITITSGATEALFSTIVALTGPGDDVVLFDPAYDSYEPAVRVAGARARRLPLASDSYRIDFDALERVMRPSVRLIVINTPHNPTGVVWPQRDIERLGEIASASARCLVLADEVYEHIVFEGSDHRCVLATEALRERSVAVSSFGKTYHATGWKVGYCVASPALTAEIRRVHQFNTFTTATPLQWALADFMHSDPGFADGIGGFYQARRDRFRELLGPSRFELAASQGTYFQVADYSAISDEPDTDFARRLTAEHGVAAIPISVFSEVPSGERRVRFCFAKEDPTLEEAARRLCRI